MQGCSPHVLMISNSPCCEPGIYSFIRPVVVFFAPGMSAEQRAMLFID